MTNGWTDGPWDVVQSGMRLPRGKSHP